MNTQKHLSPFAACLCIIIALTGCTGNLVEVTVVDERTALENQILGTYEELNKEVLLVSSVRYIDPKGKLKKAKTMPAGKKKTIRALQRMSFNKDDIDQLKATGILGENNRGGISLLKPKDVTADKKAFTDALIKQENSDREVVMLRVIATNENLTKKDLTKVKKMFASLNRDKAIKGDMIQQEDGTWTKKAGE